MNDFINQMAFGWYPYLAVTVLVVGSIFRFDAHQFGILREEVKASR